MSGTAAANLRPPRRTAALGFQRPLDSVQLGGQLRGVLRIDFREEFGRGVRALEKFRFFRRADNQPKRLLIGIVEHLAQRVRSDQNRSEGGDSQGLRTDAHATDALENKVKFLLTNVFVERVGAFGREPPEARGKVFAAGALQEIRVRDAHQVGRTPDEIVWGDQAETCKGFHCGRFARKRKSKKEEQVPSDE